MKLATPSDVPAIVMALAKLLKESPAPQMRWADLMQAELSVRDAIHNERAVLVGDYFIMYDVGSPWYSTEKFLMEDIILRISRTKGNPVSDAIDALEALRKQHNCVATVVGDTQIGYMGPRYVKRGFTLLGNQFIKG